MDDTDETTTEDIEEHNYVDLKWHYVPRILLE